MKADRQNLGSSLVSRVATTLESLGGQMTRELETCLLALEPRARTYTTLQVSHVPIGPSKLPFPVIEGADGKVFLGPDRNFTGTAKRLPLSIPGRPLQSKEGFSFNIAFGLAFEGHVSSLVVRDLKELDGEAASWLGAALPAPGQALRTPIPLEVSVVGSVKPPRVGSLKAADEKILNSGDIVLNNELGAHLGHLMHRPGFDKLQAGDEFAPAHLANAEVTQSFSIWCVKNAIRAHLRETLNMQAVSTEAWQASLRGLDQSLLQRLVEFRFLARLGDYASFAQMREQQRDRTLLAIKVFPILQDLRELESLPTTARAVENGAPLIQALAEDLEVPPHAVRSMRDVSPNHLSYATGSPFGSEHRKLRVMGRIAAAFEASKCPHQNLPRQEDASQKSLSWEAIFRIFQRLRLLDNEQRLIGGENLVRRLGTAAPWTAITTKAEVDELGERAQQIGDAIDDIGARILFPLLVRSGISDIHRVEVGTISHYQLRRFLISGTPGMFIAGEKRALQGDEILNAFLGPSGWRDLERMSSDWHERQAGLRAAIADISGTTSIDGATWLELSPSWTAPNRVRIESRTTPASLIQEGEALDHCVGGYRSACLLERTHVIGLTDAAGHRVSTAQITLDQIDQKPGWKLSVVQHRSTRNSSPSNAASAALDAYLEAIRSGELKVDYAGLEAARLERVQMAKSLDSVSGIAGFDMYDPKQIVAVWDAYRSVLPPHLRRLTWAEGMGRIASRLPEDLRPMVAAWVIETNEQLHEARPDGNVVGDPAPY